MDKRFCDATPIFFFFFRQELISSVAGIPPLSVHMDRCPFLMQRGNDMLAQSSRSSEWSIAVTLSHQSLTLSDLDSLVF